MKNYFNGRFLGIPARYWALLVVILILSGIGIFANFALDGDHWSWKIARIAADAILIVALGVWIGFSFQIIGPDDMAVEIAFGYPLGWRDSGLQFIPWMFRQWYLKKYSKKTYNLVYAKKSVITKADYYPPLLPGTPLHTYSPENPPPGCAYYGAQVLEVDAVGYINFPRSRGLFPDPDNPGYLKKEPTHPLIKILRAGVPTDVKELTSWTEEAIVGTIRVVLGDKTWREATEDLDEINKELDKAFTDQKGPLAKAGFRKPGLKIVIQEIRLPSGLQSALELVDEERVKRDAAKFSAETETLENMGVFKRQFAHITGKSMNEIEAYIQGDPARLKEVFDLCKEFTLRDETLKLGGKVIDIKLPPGIGGLDGAFFSLVTLFKSLGEGGSGGGQTSSENQKSDATNRGEKKKGKFKQSQTPDNNNDDDEDDDQDDSYKNRG